MMRKLALYLGVAVALPLLAQTQSTQAPAPPTADPYTPALLSNVNDSAHDSRLVRAAKQTVVARRRLNGKTWRIDDSMVGHSLTAEDAPSQQGSGRSAANRGGFASDQASARTVGSSAKGPSSAQLQQQKEQLKNEQSRMAEEAAQPYAGDVDEGRSEQRLTQTPTQIKTIDQQMQQQQPPPER